MVTSLGVVLADDHARFRGVVRDALESDGCTVLAEVANAADAVTACVEHAPDVALLDIPTCIGAKHSSLERAPEWDRLRLRDERRTDFMVLTGNDLAIDMVCFGSDYLLGISTFAPDLFAERDRRWAESDPSFHQLNDDLQYLGRFAFRDPVPAYKHSAAQFLRLRGWIDHDVTPRGAPERPASDVAVLAEIGERLGVVDAGLERP